MPITAVYRSQGRSNKAGPFPCPGLAPPLHLPVMAGLAQGPGFPNLSCLGLLSRILRRYVTASDTGSLVPQRRERA